MWCRTSKRWIIVISPVWRRWTRLFFAPWILFYGPHKRNVRRYTFRRGALHFGIHKFRPRSNKTDNSQQISMARASVYPCTLYDCGCVGITKICSMTKNVRTIRLARTVLGANATEIWLENRHSFDLVVFAWHCCYGFNHRKEDARYIINIMVMETTVGTFRTDTGAWT